MKRTILSGLAALTLLGAGTGAGTATVDCREHKGPEQRITQEATPSFSGLEGMVSVPGLNTTDIDLVQNTMPLPYSAGISEYRDRRKTPSGNIVASAAWIGVAFPNNLEYLATPSSPEKGAKLLGELQKSNAWKWMNGGKDTNFRYPATLDYNNLVIDGKILEAYITDPTLLDSVPVQEFVVPDSLVSSAFDKYSPHLGSEYHTGRGRDATESWIRLLNLQQSVRSSREGELEKRNTLIHDPDPVIYLPTGSHRDGGNVVFEGYRIDYLEQMPPLKITDKEKS
ncbi:MAG: hypothetical protein ABIA93_05645 [Candidatus Woesearchaeota archaeon]